MSKEFQVLALCILSFAAGVVIMNELMVDKLIEAGYAERVGNKLEWVICE